MDKEVGYLHCYTWNGYTWQYLQFLTRSDGTDDNDFWGTNKTNITNGNLNYFVQFDQRDSHDDDIYVFYLNECLEWDSTKYNCSCNIDGGGNHPIYLYYGPTFVCVMLSDNISDRIFSWDSTYTTISRDYTFSGIPYFNPAYVYGSSISLLDNDRYHKFLRYNGYNWKGYSANANNTLGWAEQNLNYSFCPNKDLLLLTYPEYNELGQFFGTYFILRYQYDPNYEILNGTYLIDEEGVDERYFAISAGNHYYLYRDNNSIKMYTLNGSSWNVGNSNTINKMLAGSNFFLRQENPSAGKADTKVGLIKNNKYHTPSQLWLEDQAIYDMNNNIQQPQTTSSSIFVTFNDEEIENSDTLRLYKVINYEYQGKLKDIPVSSLIYNNGYSTDTINFVYDSTTATYDPSGTIAQYNKVTTTKGNGDNGYTETYFFNNLPYNEVSLAYPASDSYTNARDNYSYLTGSPYCTKVYNGNDQLISYSWNYYYVDTLHLGQKDIGIRTEIRKILSVTDNLSTTINKIYSKQNGLDSLTTTYSSDGTAVITKITYAYEEYSNMKSNHMLSQVAQQTVYETSVSNTNAYQSSVTTYKDWGSGKWAPNKSYVWEEDKNESRSLPDFNFSSWSGLTEPSGGDGQEWKLQSKISNRNSSGQVEEVVDADGVLHQIKYVDEKYPIASVSNIEDEEETFIALFDFNDLGSLSDGNVIEDDRWQVYQNSSGTGTVTIVDDEKFTGTNSLRITNPHNSGSWCCFYVCADQTRDEDYFQGGKKYIFSARVKTTDSEVGLDFSYKDSQGADHYGEKVVYADGTGDWELITLSYTMPNDYSWAKFHVFVDGTSDGTPDTAYIDNVRIYPSDALMTSTAYDPDTYEVLDKIDANGIAISTEISESERYSRVLNDEKYILSSSRHYFSRTWNDDTLNVNDPNYIESISYSDGLPTNGLVGQWVFEGDCKDESANNNNGTIVGNTCFARGYFGMGMSFDGNGDYVDVGEDGLPFGETSNAWTVCAWIYPEQLHTYTTNHYTDNVFFAKASDDYNDNLEIGVEADNGKIEVYLDTDNYDVSAENFQSNSSISENEWTFVAITFDKNAGQAKIYINGELDKTSSNYSSSMDGAEGSPVTIGASIHSDVYFDGLIDEVLVFDYALSAGEVKSIAKPTISTIYLNGFGSEIQTQVRDGDSTIVSKSSHNFSANIDTIYYSQKYYNPDHDFYPCTPSKYEIVTHYNDPTSRKYKTIHPDTKYIEKSYGKHTFMSVGDFSVTITKDEIGTMTKTYRDESGSIYKTTVIAADLGDSLETFYEYDILGNTTKITDPKGLETHMWYDTRGRLIKKSTPDAGTIQYIYDNSGKLVFSQDSNQVAGNDFTVYKYDGLGRNIITAVEDDQTFTWTGTSYPSVSNLSSYGTESSEIKIRNYYDTDYINDGENYCHGKLTKTISYDENEDSTETRYAYDKYGNITVKKIKIPGMLDYKTVYHFYDKQGREIITEYPSGLIITRSYNHLGQLEKIETLEY